MQNGKIPEKSLSLVLSELSEEHVGDRMVVGRIASSARSDGQVPIARSYSAPSDPLGAVVEMVVLVVFCVEEVDPSTGMRRPRWV